MEAFDKMMAKYAGFRFSRLNKKTGLNQKRFILIPGWFL